MKTMFFIILFTLCGCAGSNSMKGHGAFPVYYQDVIKEYVKRNFFDPYSIRDASLSNVVEGHIGWRNGWVVCLECNSKNRMGGYTGLDRTMILIRNGDVVGVENNSRACYDNNLFKFTPWPEIDGVVPK